MLPLRSLATGSIQSAQPRAGDAAPTGNGSARSANRSGRAERPLHDTAELPQPHLALALAAVGATHAGLLLLAWHATSDRDLRPPPTPLVVRLIDERAARSDAIASPPQALAAIPAPAAPPTRDPKASARTSAAPPPASPSTRAPQVARPRAATLPPPNPLLATNAPASSTTRTQNTTTATPTAAATATAAAATPTPSPPNIAIASMPEPAAGPATAASPSPARSVVEAATPVDAGVPVASAPAAPAAPSATADKVIPASAVQYLEPLAPEYPRMARRLGEHGQVLVRVYIDATGAAHRTQVARTSGHPRLDEAALSAVQRARFRPYTENGRAVAGWAFIPIEFELET